MIRYGGDEFVVLAPNVQPDEAEKIVEGIHSHIRKMSDALVFGFDITASIGYVLADDSRKSLGEYINDADERMYEIKRIHHAKNCRKE